MIMCMKDAPNFVSSINLKWECLQHRNSSINETAPKQAIWTRRYRSTHSKLGPRFRQPDSLSRTLLSLADRMELKKEIHQAMGNLISKNLFSRWSQMAFLPAGFSVTIKQHLLLRYTFILGSPEIQATESLCWVVKSFPVHEFAVSPCELVKKSQFSHQILRDYKLGIAFVCLSAEYPNGGKKNLRMHLPDLHKSRP